MIGLSELMFAVRKARLDEREERFRLEPGLVIDPLRLRVLRDGQEIPVEPRVMELLLYFRDRAGQVISKRQLMDEVWRSNVVDDAIHRAISLLRSALGDSAQEPKLIETVPKRGYRMLVTPAPLRGSDPSRPLPWIAAAVALLVVIGVLAPKHDRAGLREAIPEARSTALVAPTFTPPTAKHKEDSRGQQSKANLALSATTRLVRASRTRDQGTKPPPVDETMLAPVAPIAQPGIPLATTPAPSALRDPTPVARQ